MMERDLNSNGTFEETERFFYHADGLGSIVALSNSTGQVVERYRYDSFGQPTITGPGPDGLIDTPDDVTLTESAYGNPYLFTSREWDPETGLYHIRSRYFDPRMGGFLQEDRIAGFLFNPQSLNRYPYVENNPINFTDPFGLQKRRGAPEGTEEIIRLIATESLSGAAVTVEIVAISLHRVPSVCPQLLGFGLDLLALGIEAVAIDLAPGVDVRIIPDNDPSDITDKPTGRSRK